VSRRPLAVRLDPRTPEAEYALGVLLDLLGLEPFSGSEQAQLGYGAGAGRCLIPAGPQESWDDPRPQVTRADGLAILHRPGGPARVRTEAAQLGFDVLYAAYASLTAPWERADTVDTVGCPLAAEGFLGREGLLGEPLVHRYAAVLAAALREAGADVVPPRVDGAIVLTHDVDDNFAHLFGVRERWKRLHRELVAGRPSAVRRLGGLVKRLATRGPDPNDRFDDWGGWHRAWGGRPTYFVASHGLFRRDSDPVDVAYDLRHPRVAATVRRARDEGAEIGVHFSIRARESSERLRREREALEEVIGAPVHVARHHWWALGIPAETTLRLHPRAGIELDCSLGFNDHPGFRRGIAAPFRPFDPETREAMPAWSLPTAAMDAAVFDGRRTDVEAVLELRSLLGAVREVGGTLVLDWHVHSANPAALPGAAVGLRRFLDEAVGEGAALRTPLELVAEWKRR
jgi:hypothetical protein